MKTLRFIIGFVIGWLLGEFLITKARANEFQKEIVAAVIINEAGGEGADGMQAVANVIANRMVKGRTAYQVVTKPAQFNGYDAVRFKKISETGLVNKAKRHKRWAAALALATQVEQRRCRDITGGATHYHALSVQPYWANIFAFTKQIKGHRFYKENA